MGNHAIPVRNLHREVDGWHPDRVGAIGCMNLRAQHLLVPQSSALAIANLDIDVLDQCHPRAGQGY